MKAERIRIGLFHALGVGLAAVAMGGAIGAMSLPEYGPLLQIDVGSAIIGISLLAGIALGLQTSDEEPAGVILRTFLASLGAIAMVAATILAPMIAGVVTTLDAVDASGSARLGLIFTALFIVPIHVLGGVIGFGLADSLAPAAYGESKGRLEGG
jgi:hypothetical protein